MRWGRWECVFDEWVIFVSQVVAMGGGAPSDLFGELCKEV